MKLISAFVVAILTLGFSTGYSQDWQPAKSSHFGMDGFETADFFHLTSQQIDSAYEWETQGLINAKIAWNRTLSPAGGQFRWDVIESVPGTYDWSKPDAFVKKIQPKNLHLLVLVHPYARWDQPGKTGMDYDKPNDMSAFKRFIARLVERYDGDGIDDMPGLQYPIEYFEIGNEPEGATFGNAPGTYNAFMETVKAARDTAKNAFSGVKIVIGGTSPIYDTHGLNSGVASFWAGALNRPNITTYFDIFNFHFFVGQYTQDISSYLTYWKQVLSTYGLSDKEIWISETGTYSGTSTGPDGASWPTQTPEYQAGWWVKQSAYSLANGVSKIFWVFYYTDQNDWKSTVAFINRDKSTAKPVFYSQRLMAEKIDAYSSVVQNASSALSQYQTSGNFRFTIGGNPVTILWNDQGGNATLTGLGTSMAKVTRAVPLLDANGNAVLDTAGNPSFQTTNSTVTGGQISVQLSSVPVFVEQVLSPPGIPALVYPENNGTGISLTPSLVWQRSSRADSYHLQLSIDSLFTSLLIDDSTIVDTVSHAGPLNNATTYYWRVGTIGADGASAYPHFWKFTTTPPSEADSIITKLFRDSYHTIKLMRRPNGVYLDALTLSSTDKPASIAANGVGLLSLCIADSMYKKTGDATHWESHASDSVSRTLSDFIAFRNSGEIKAKGLYRRFFDASTGGEFGTWGTEFSTIDNAIFAAGLIFCKNYFTADTSVVHMANDILSGMDFTSAISEDGRQLYMAENRDGAGIRPTGAFNEYMIVAWLAKNVAHSNPGFSKSETYWNTFYSHPKTASISRPKYCEIEVLSDGGFISSFIPQFAYYYCHYYKNNADYMEYFSNARKADSLWWTNACVGKEPYIWGLGAGEDPGGGYYSANAIDSNPSLIVSPHIIAGFIPCYPQGKDDLISLLQDVSRPAVYALPDDSSRKVLWRYSYTTPAVRCNYIEAVNFATMLYGLATLPEFLGSDFFDTNNLLVPADSTTEGIDGFKLSGFSLEQNFPNPFNPATTISFTLPERTSVVVKIFDILGRDVSTLWSGILPPGLHSRRWDASGFPSGIYYYRLQTTSYTETRKLVLVR